MSEASSPSAEMALFNYEGATVRTLTIDGEPWFVAKDVTDLLGFSDGPGAIRKHVSAGQRRQAKMASPASITGFQMMTIVNEPGLYRLIMRSNVSGAERFQDWVTGEVLPAIRKTGAYSLAVPHSIPTDYPSALEEAARQARRAIEAEARSLQLTAKVEADAPKVNYVDTFVADDDLQKFRTVAATLGMRESALRNLLVAKRWIYVEQSTRWSASREQYEKIQRYSAHTEKRDYFKAVKRHEAPLFKGEVMHTLKITPAGAEAIARLVKRSQAAA